MKVALVHELLTMKGGAEHVLGVLADMFPEAPIYTLLYDEKLFGDRFPKSRVRTSTLQKWTWLTKNHHWYLNRFASAVEAWDFSEFDLVISSSSAFAHGVLTNGKPKHICYVQSPARYLWDRTHETMRRVSSGPVGWIRRPVFERLFCRLRIWDTEAAGRADVLLAASREVQRRIELYWDKKSTVVYPPIDDFWFSGETKRVMTAESPFVIVSTLVPYKRIDIAIDACNQLQLPLVIAGDGPARASLQKLAGPTVKFLGYVPKEQLKNLFSSARATIFPGDEDFGLVPLESMSCGTPVIAYKSGGALETIDEGTTGTFFPEPTAASLMSVLQTFNANRFAADACKEQAKRFTRHQFTKAILGQAGSQ